jgi:hypothetical protein
MLLLLPSFGWSAENSTSRLSLPQLQEPGLIRPERHNTEIYLYLRLQGNNAHDERELELRDSVLTRAKFDINHRFSDFFKTHLAASAQFETGRVRSAYEDNKLSSGFFVEDANFSFTPGSNFSLSMGALNQGSAGNPLLIDDIPLPGGAENIFYRNTNFEIGLLAQQLVATSQSFATNTVEEEPTPYFFTESLYLNLKVNSDWDVKSFASHFRFRDLPMAVASDSRMRGNSTENFGAAQSVFLYEFSGFSGGISTDFQAGRIFGFKAGAILLQNTEAVPGRDKGQLYFIALPLRVTSEINIIPRFEYFVNQSDSSPAFYNSSLYGNNNRQGSLAELKFDFVKQNFSLIARYVDAQIIEENPFQSRNQTFMIRVETRNALL